MSLLEREWGPDLFCFLFNFNFNIISHNFPENVIAKIAQVILKIWKFFRSILAIFIYFSDFLTFLYYIETNGVTYNRWCQQCFTFSLLLIGCLTLLAFMFVPDFVTLLKISLKCGSGQEEIVQLGNVSRGSVVTLCIYVCIIYLKSVNFTKIANYIYKIYNR